MKLNKTLLGIGTLVAAGMFAIAADHIDAPAVKGGTADITDFYAFQGENTSNHSWCICRILKRAVHFGY